MEDCNLQSLANCGNGVIKIEAEHHGQGAKEVKSDDAGNLQAVIYLAIGAKVMLTENLWVERGLVNGSMGILKDIVWREGSNPRIDKHSMLLVYFPQYNGPGIARNDETYVPIFEVKHDFVLPGGRRTCWRKQFPLTLAYSITVHKSQGLSLDKAVLNFEDKEFATGLQYVALSRIKLFEGLMFESAFDYSAISLRPNAQFSMQQIDQQKRQHIDSVERLLEQLLNWEFDLNLISVGEHEMIGDVDNLETDSVSVRD